MIYLYSNASDNKPQESSINPQPSRSTLQDVTTNYHLMCHTSAFLIFFLYLQQCMVLSLYLLIDFEKNSMRLIQNGARLPFDYPELYVISIYEDLIKVSANVASKHSYWKRICVCIYQ
jgi:hypothetical protein